MMPVVAQLIQNFRLQDGRGIVGIVLDTRLMCLDNPVLQTMVTAAANTLIYHGIVVFDLSEMYARLKHAADSPNWHTIHTTDTVRIWEETLESMITLMDCFLTRQYKQAVLELNLAPPTPRLDNLHGASRPGLAHGNPAGQLAARAHGEQTTATGIRGRKVGRSHSG